jgi:hypothetical protein
VASLQAYISHGIRYCRIVESFRKEGKPSIRVLAHLGRVDEMLHRHQQHSEVPVKISSVSAGAVTALVRLATELAGVSTTRPTLFWTPCADASPRRYAVGGG